MGTRDGGASPARQIGDPIQQIGDGDEGASGLLRPRFRTNRGRGVHWGGGASPPPGKSGTKVPSPSPGKFDGDGDGEDGDGVRALHGPLRPGWSAAGRRGPFEFRSLLEGAK